ncbi:hypothetical protein TD82_004937, partial [Salmonella enterica subsp. enterica]|nr:hypothetical protein [Salmonella enterica subsp. enterica]
MCETGRRNAAFLQKNASTQDRIYACLLIYILDIMQAHFTTKSACIMSDKESKEPTGKSKGGVARA